MHSTETQDAPTMPQDCQEQQGEVASSQPKKADTRPAKSNGRPSSYDPAVAFEICERIANGRKGLDLVCREEPDWPSARTVAYWLEQYPDFLQRYVRAKERQADFIFDECLQIADDGSNDTFEDANGNVRVDVDVIQRSKLRVDTRMRIAGKLHPKKYGENGSHSTTVNLGVQVTVNTDAKLADLAERKRKSLERRRQARLTAGTSGPVIDVTATPVTQPGTGDTPSQPGAGPA